MTGRAENDAVYAVAIGGANVDIHGTSGEAIRLNDSNPGEVHTSAGGVARNVAENLARLDVDSRLVSIVGDDHFGHRLLRQTQNAGVDVQHVQITDAVPTSTYLSVLDDRGDMHVAISDMSILDHFNMAKLRSLQPLIRGSSLIAIDANLADDALAWLTTEFATQPIFADTVSTHKANRLKSYLSSIHTLKTSVSEAEVLCGRPARTASQLEEIAKQLHASGVTRVFITRGDQGVFYSTGGEQGNRAPLRERPSVCNVGGAGDAFLSGLAYSWLRNFPLNRSLRFALATADITLAHAATTNPVLSVAAVKQTLALERGA